MTEIQEEDFLPAILALFPDAEVGSDNDAQLVVYTGCTWGGKNGELVDGNINLSRDIFIVAWTGGYEQPSYAAHRLLEDAKERAKEWDEQSKEGDSIDILRVDAAKLLIERIPWKDDDE